MRERRRSTAVLPEHSSQLLELAVVVAVVAVMLQLPQLQLVHLAQQQA